MPAPNDLVGCVAGLDFGVIDDSVAKAIGRQAGPIRLPFGVSGPRGFGEQHVEKQAKRMAAVRDYGFPTFVAYAYFICQGYEWIAADRDRLALVRPKDGYDHTVIVEHKEEQGHWTITTGILKRVHRAEKLWVREQAGRSEPSPGVVEKRPRRETLTLRKS